MNNLSKNKIEKLLLILFVIFLISYYSFDAINKKELRNDYVETIGIIDDYYVVFPETHYCVYKFSVEGTTYKKTVNPDIILKDCAKTKSCLGKKYLVRYKRDNPNISELLLKYPR